jgi:hypothetical protein
MVSVGDFCSVGTASDLLVVEAMWKQRGGVVGLAPTKPDTNSPLN